MTIPLPKQRRSTRFFVQHHQAILVASLCLILAIGVRIDRVLLNTFPTGGDNGGHLGMPAYVRRVLAPQWRLTGWSNDWFAGVPILALYFPLPTWIIIALDTVLPYSIAYKLVTIAGTVLLPWAAWRLGRKASLSSPAPLFLAMASVAYLLNRSYRILGGNILSTMAGEFSFSLSLLFCVLYFGSLLDVVRHGTHRVSAVVFLAATGLCHVVPSMLAVVGTGALLLSFADRSRLRQQIIGTLTVGTIGTLLAAFWIVPFASLLPYTNSMDYERNTLLRTSLLPFLPGKHTLHVLPDGGALIAGAFAFAMVAIAWGLWRRSPFVSAFVLMGGAAAIGFVVWPTGSMWNNRLLPMWFFAIFLLGGVGAAAIVGRLTRSSAVASVSGVAIMFIALAPTFDALPGWFPLPVHAKSGWQFEALKDNKEYRSADLPFAWASTNAEGMQRKKSWPEFRALMGSLNTLPCGRLFWEQDKGYVRFGSSMSLMAIPFFTKSCIQSVEGLYFESTQTTPFSFITSSLVSNAPSNPQRDLRYGSFDLDRGVDRLRRLGARYLLASSDRLKNAARTRADLREVARSGKFIVYEIGNHAVVEPLTARPVVVRGASAGLDGGFMDLGLAQWSDPTTFPDTYVVDGPADWPRADLTVKRTRAPGKLRDTRGTGVSITPLRPTAAPAQPGVAVTEVDLQPTSLRFHVDRVGVPVLVRMSWSPGWRAKGASQILRAAPNFFVVVPTANNVSITMARTGPELLGHGLSAVGLVALGALVVGDRRRRPSAVLGASTLSTQGEPERGQPAQGSDDARDDGSAGRTGLLDPHTDLPSAEPRPLEAEDEFGIEEIGPEETISR